MKVNIRFLVNQQTNYGYVMEGEEKLIPEESANLFVQRDIAEYVIVETKPIDLPEVFDPFDTDTMEALTEEIDSPFVVKDSDKIIISELPEETPPKRKKRSRRKSYKATDEN